MTLIIFYIFGAGLWHDWYCNVIIDTGQNVQDFSITIYPEYMNVVLAVLVINPCSIYDHLVWKHCILFWRGWHPDQVFASVSTFFGSLFDNFDVVEMTYDGTLQQRTMISRVDAFQIKGYFLFAVKSRVRMRVINKYSDRTTCSGQRTILYYNSSSRYSCQNLVF